MLDQIERNPAFKTKVRQRKIVDLFTKYYGEEMLANPKAWQTKFRKMAASPFTFYRGSALLFYQDLAEANNQQFLDEKTSRVWIQGDLHAQNFGTYMNAQGILVFDVNDFDESFVAPYIWDLKRLAASLTLIGYQKALSDSDIRQLIETTSKAYAKQVAAFTTEESSKDFALTLENTNGAVNDALYEARLRSKLQHLNIFTTISDHDRQFKIGKFNSKINKRTYRKVEKAFKKYLTTIPKNKQLASSNYHIKDIVETHGIGIGSAGLEIYTLLLEGPNQALENDIVISIKQGAESAVSKVIKDPSIQDYFLHNGHRTVLSQRALQAHADPWLGYTTLNGIGRLVTEVSPYTVGLDWEDINDMGDLLETVTYLGQATAKIHCVSDVDSDQDLVPFSTEFAINHVLEEKTDAFVQHLVDFGIQYGNQTRKDYTLFVDAFRNHQFEGI